MTNHAAVGNSVDEWLFASIYPAEPDGLSELVHTIIAPAWVETNVAEVRRRFWLRYTDSGGVHLRLRVLARPAVVEHVLHTVEAVLPPRTSLHLGIYQPEANLYGRGRGVLLAEERFEESSDLCLRLLLADPTRGEVLEIAAALMARAASVMLPEDCIADFWHAVARRWARWSRLPILESDGGVSALPFDDTPEPAALRSESSAIADWLAGFAAVRNMLAEVGSSEPPGRKGQGLHGQSLVSWLFLLTHLTANRLGISQLDEARVALHLSGGIRASGIPCG